MPESPESERFLSILKVLASGTVEQLEDLRQRIAGFPEGVDDIMNRHWITNAIDSGSRTAVEWIVTKGVDLSFRDDEGRTVLSATLDRESEDRHDMLDLLLEAGAPVNIRGIYEMTPAHLAAMRGDVEALRIFLEHGADLSLEDCDSLTPLESASKRAREFLEKVAQDPGK